MKTNARSPDRTAGAVNGAVRTDEEEDTLSKARKAAKVHLNALKEHVDKAMEAFHSLEGVVFSAAEAVKADRRALIEDSLQAQNERRKLEAELHAKQEQLQREQEELRRARTELELDRQKLEKQRAVTAPAENHTAQLPTRPKPPGEAVIQKVIPQNLVTGTPTWSPLLMPSRRIIVFGGFDGKADHLSTEILDATSMTFSSGPTMAVGRSGCAVAGLDERRVLVAGGFDGCRSAALRSLDSTELVDPVTLKVIPGPKMGTRRNACAAVRLDAKRLLIIGGSDDSSELDSTELLDLERMVFSVGPKMGTRRNACAASLIDTHRLLVIGGSDGGSDLDTTELLDVTTMTFSAGPRMSTRRNFCATALLQPAGGKGTLLVLGGSDGSNSLDSTEVLDVSKLTFSPGPGMNAWRSGCSATPLSSDQLLVVGGFDGSNHLDSTELLDLKEMSFSDGPRLSTWRSGASKQTLLAPTDDAFMALGRGVATSLLLISNREDLVALIQLHMIEGAKTSMDMVARTNIVSRQGEAVTVGSLNPLTFNEAVASVQDVPTTNGVLHILDQVVTPKLWRFPERNFMQFANKERDLSEFVRLVSFSGLVEEFQGNGPFTAMIPNDYAFSQLGSSVNNLLLPENAQKLKDFLRYHVVVGKYLSIHLTSPQNLETLQGQQLSAVPWTKLGWTGIAYQSASPPVVVNGEAQVVTPDVLATNGVVHIIDHVLFPPGVDLSFFDTTLPPLFAATSRAFGKTLSALALICFFVVGISG
eukprot:symbB.v1.2.005689.t1/scaffold334.1/size226555/12